MRLILDESVPRRMKGWFSDKDVRTVVELGWGGVKNGQLLRLVSDQADVFITADKNLQFQQNLSQVSFAILVLPTNRWKLLQPFKEVVLDAIRIAKPGQVVMVT